MENNLTQNQMQSLPASQIADITWFNIRWFQPEDLNDEKTYEKFVRFVRWIDDATNGAEAGEVFDILWGLLNNNSDLAQNNPDLAQKYFELLTVLRANFLSMVGDEEVERFLKELALQAITISLFSIPYFSLREKLWQFIRFDTWYFDVEVKKNMRNALVQAMDSNEELLGEDGIVVKGKNFKSIQTVANWLRDYNLNFPFYNKPRSTVDRYGYLNTNMNVKQLDDHQKTILSELLEFYDWLRFADIEHEQFIMDERQFYGMPAMPGMISSKGLLFPQPHPVVSAPAPVRVQTLPTLPPVELRDQSTPGIKVDRRPEAVDRKATPELRPTITGLRILPPAPRPRRKATSNEQRATLQTPSPIANRQSLSESLYRSSLDELQKMRKEFEKKGDSRPETVDRQSRTTDYELLSTNSKPYSINDALINAGNKIQNADHGVTSGKPEKEDKEIEDKLHKLEDRIR